MFRVVPSMRSVSASRGSSEGNLLTIQGYSFGGEKSDYEILAGGHPCEVKSVKNEEIVCEVNPGAPIV
jgi:hypothetical protein